MRSMFYLFLILGSITLVFCKKSAKPVPVMLNPLSDDFRKSWFFNKGSYWIVKDSVSGKTDSIYITEVNRNPKIYYSENKRIFENITMTFNKSTLFGNLTLSCVFGTQIETLLPYYNNAYSILREDTLAFSVSPDYGLYKSEVLENFESGGIIHPTVRTVYYRYEFNYPSHAVYIMTGSLYWRKGVGIVKKIDYPEFPGDRKVYEVIRYKIVQ